MFRLVLTILVALPMLVPPGMCLCQFASTGSANAGTGFRSEERHAAGRSDCHCDMCLGHAIADVGTDVNGRKTTPSDRPVSPWHDDHAPNCPAALGDVPTKIAAPTVTIQVDSDINFGFVASIVERTAIRARDHDIVGHSTTSPPLFIAYCTLLI